MPPHPLTNVKTRRYYQNEPIFNGVYSRDKLPKKKQDGVYMLNFDEYADVGCYFNSSGVEYVPKEIEKFIRHKNKKFYM